MNSITIWLTDPEADNYPFSHKIGERLRSPAKNIEGIVRNAKCAGTEDGKSVWITYYIEPDNGKIIQLPSADLEKVGQPIQQRFFK
jgi:hypothetical protein